MTVRDAQNNPSIPPASCGAPCVPQPGAVGPLLSSPSPFASQPMETHLFSPSPSGFSLDDKGPVPGHVDIPDIDDDDFGDQGPSRRF